jgi:hypothetical protein
MQSMILIYGNENAWAEMSEAERANGFAAFMEYNKKLASSGALRGGGQLQPSRTARTVKAKDGKLVTVDGPFAETREQLGGYYVVEVETHEAATALAAECPAAWGGAIEVRPLLPSNF